MFEGSSWLAQAFRLAVAALFLLGVAVLTLWRLLTPA